MELPEEDERKESGDVVGRLRKALCGTPRCASPVAKAGAKKHA